MSEDPRDDRPGPSDSDQAPWFFRNDPLYRLAWRHRTVAAAVISLWNFAGLLWMPDLVPRDTDPTTATAIRVLVIITGVVFATLFVISLLRDRRARADTRRGGGRPSDA